MRLKLIIRGRPRTSIWSRFMFPFPYLSVTALPFLPPPNVHPENPHESPLKRPPKQHLVLKIMRRLEKSEKVL